MSRKAAGSQWSSAEPDMLLLEHRAARPERLIALLSHFAITKATKLLNELQSTNVRTSRILVLLGGSVTGKTAVAHDRRLWAHRELRACADARGSLRVEWRGPSDVHPSLVLVSSQSTLPIL